VETLSIACMRPSLGDEIQGFRVRLPHVSGVR